MSTPERRQFTSAAKVAILRKHFLEGWPVSEVCAEAGIAVSQFYYWQKIFFEQGAAAFENSRVAKLALTCKTLSGQALLDLMQSEPMTTAYPNLILRDRLLDFFEIKPVKDLPEPFDEMNSRGVILLIDAARIQIGR